MRLYQFCNNATILKDIFQYQNNFERYFSQRLLEKKHPGQIILIKKRNILDDELNAYIRGVFHSNLQHCDAVIHASCDAALVDESQESQRQSCGQRHLTCCSPLFSFHGPRTGHSSLEQHSRTLFTSVACTLLPLCPAVKLVCHWFSVMIL